MRIESCGPRRSRTSRRTRGVTISCRRAVDLVFLPEVLLQSLHPLEVRDDDAAGVREHVRQDSTPFASRMSSAAGVTGPFAPSTRIFAFTSVGVVLRDHLLERARREERRSRAASSSSFVMRSPPFNSVSEPPPRLCANAAAMSMPFALWMPPDESEIGDDLRAFLGGELREERADVAESLHRDADPVQRPALLLERGLKAEERRRARSLPHDRASRRSSTACR